MSHSQSLIHSAYDSAESITTPPDSDPEDEQLRMMLASPLKTEVSVKPGAENAQKREANAQRAQACHSERESSMSMSSRDLNAFGKPIATKSSGYSKNSKAGDRKWPHNFHMSPATVTHVEKVYSIVRQNLRAISNE